MKTIKEKSGLWAGFFCLGMTLMAGLPAAPAAEPAAESEKPKAGTAEAPIEYRNWFDVSVGIITINGDDAQFARRKQMPEGVFGGVESFHWEQDVGKRGLFTIDGRGLVDHHDYAVRLELSHPDQGFVRAGYREFRTWYDGSGGFFPANGQWIELYDDELELDRGEIWFEAGLRRPGIPEFTVRYEHQFREGLKDSTIWGDSNLTGGLGGRGLVPSYLRIDETRDIFQFDAKHTFGKTDVGLGLRYELGDQDNSRNMRRRPMESADRYVSQTDKVDTELFNVHAFTTTRFNDAILFTTGYSFTSLDTDTSGSRIYGQGYEPLYDPLYARRQPRDEGYFGLAGGANLNQYVLNLNLMFTPWANVYIVPSVRIEKQDIDAQSAFTETNVGNGPAFTSSQEELAAFSERDLVDVAEALEIRYTGLTNWVLYARANWMQGEGNQLEREILLLTGTSDLLRDTDFNRFMQKYAVGANWYPLRRLNLAVQYYHKTRNEDYGHREDSTPNRAGNRYPAFLTAHDFTTDDTNFRLTWRPQNNLTLVSRYDFQLSTIDMTGAALDPVQSSEVTTHILSQSVSWTPLPRIYLQGSINYVMDQTDTPAAGVSSTNLVPNAANDYWTTTATAGFVIDNKTDLQLQYFFYRADNFADNSEATQPYGVGAEEHSITATLMRRLSPRLHWTLRYGFFNYRDQTSGGHNDYDAHLAYSSIRYLF
jgi:hypothetical protein